MHCRSINFSFKMLKKIKIIRITTIPDSLKILLKHQVKFCGDNGFDMTMVSSDGDCIPELIEQENAPHIIIPLTRKITPFKDIYALILLTRLFYKIKPDIVHSHTPKAGTIGMIAAKLARVPHRLHTIAGLPLLEITGVKRKILNFVEKITYFCATKVYPNSKSMMQIVVNEKFCKEGKLKVIGNGSSNGINTAYFDPKLFTSAENLLLRSELGISSSDFVFVFVGRIVGDKGINELIEAFENLNSSFNNIKLLLVGHLETELDPLMPKTLSAISTNKKIITVGFKNDVRPYFAIANSLVFPSYREGFPNVVMQAGAMGLPAIVSDINGCNEIIIEDKNGMIIPVKDSDALYQAMKRLMDTDLHSCLSSQARDLITARYEQKIIWESILAEYKNLTTHV